jgi:signal transduction histidine kinase
MQRNMLDFKPVNFKLYDVVNKITGISNHNAVRKKITIVNNVYHGNFVYADVDTIHSVIQNLISNAIKFTPAEGKVIVSSAAREGFIDVSVEDTGIGIEPEKIAKMFNFNSFFTTHGTAGEKGTGLGLPLCKEFVERNDGKIWVESELGKGSKFTFCLRKSQF